MAEKIKMGISACLLGKRVRYDGGHKLDHYLRDTVGRFVQWVPVCPEKGCGLSVPREPMYLVGTPDDPRLLTRDSGIDHTHMMNRWISRKLKELEKEDLCGFVFKSRSPSCGLRGVKVQEINGRSTRVRKGLFARAFTEGFPLVPVEDDERLYDPGTRRDFFERVAVFKRWREMTRKVLIKQDLIRFHEGHEFQLMAHSPQGLKRLSRMIAQIPLRPSKTLLNQYITELMDILRLRATIRKNINVLQHILKYLEKDLSPYERRDILTVIERYRQGDVPLIVPLTLLNHYAKKFKKEYLKRQTYLSIYEIYQTL